MYSAEDGPIKQTLELRHCYLQKSAFLKDSMKPVMPIPKRANGFSIESLMRKEPDNRATASPASSGDESDHTDDSPGQIPALEDRLRLSPTSRLPPLHPALPAHVKHLLLRDTNGALPSDVLALRSQAWAFSNAQMGMFPHLNNGVHSQMSNGLGIPGVGVHPSLYNTGRDPMSMYPWLMSRQAAGCFGMPFHGHPEAGLLFHPYRKPKRIRTAFSPSQLLKLEHAFEKNHYVVGQERKELAAKLSLTETQVKVWFQNRRTKHKRVRSEEESETGNISIDDDEIAASSSHYDDTMDNNYPHNSSLSTEAAM